MDAITAGDAGPAYRALKELRKMAVAGQLPASLAALEVDLYYTALPALPINDAATILSSQLTNVLQRGIDLDDRLSVRYAFTAYGDHEQERQTLRKAMLENQEVVAGKTIGAWLMEYDKAHAPNTREEKSAFDFLSNNRQLGERDRSLLRLILTPYENWLAAERLNIYDLAYLKQNPGLLAQAEARSAGSGPYASVGANQGYQQSRATGKPSRGVIKLPLLKALADYPRIGEQTVTGDKIRIKGQPEPARPNLANWIRYYRDELGVGFHDQVTRGRFLFQSENGKRLSGEERERINLVLKSIEEEYPLDIDTDRNMVLFQAQPAAPAPAAPSQPAAFRQSSTAAAASQPKLTFQTPAQMTPARPVKPYTPAPATPAAAQYANPPQEVTVSPGKGSFFGSAFGAAKNVAGETLHFSTGHVLPGEKEGVHPSTTAQGGPVAQPDLATYNMARINRHPTTAPRNPYSIRPLRLRTNVGDRESDAR